MNRRLKSLVALNVELAKLEGKQKATALGMAAGFGAGAAALVFYAVGFGFAAAAAGLSEAFPVWLSLLIVTGVLLIVAAVLGLLAKRSAGKLSPPLAVSSDPGGGTHAQDPRRACLNAAPRRSGRRSPRSGAGLGEDLDALHGDLRWLVLVPFLIGGAVAERDRVEAQAGQAGENRPQVRPPVHLSPRTRSRGSV